MVSLLIQQLYREILAVADENGGRLPNRAMFYCDEFRNATDHSIRRDDVLRFSSSRRLSIVSIIQSYHQQLKRIMGVRALKLSRTTVRLPLQAVLKPSSETKRDHLQISVHGVSDDRLSQQRQNVIPPKAWQMAERSPDDGGRAEIYEKRPLL